MISVLPLLLIAIEAVYSGSFADQELHRALMEDYDPSSLPNRDKTTLAVGMVVYGMTEVHTIDSYAVFKVNMKMLWHDERLKWDPEEFDGLEETTFFTDPG